MLSRSRFLPLLCLLSALALSTPIIGQEGTESEEEERAWSGSIGLSYLSTGGNTDTESIGFALAANREPEPWGYELAAQFDRADQDGVTTSERSLASARAKRALGERWNVFAGASWEQEEFSGIDTRTLIELGGTYEALTGPTHLLAFDLGVTWTDEDRLEPEPDADWIGGLAGLSYEWKISDGASFTQRIAYFPNFDLSDDWRARAISAVTAAINERLALQVGYELRYRNEPLGDNDDTDTTTKVSLVFQL